jgi:glycosyltransferase involved in cell wall biosynthesis
MIEQLAPAKPIVLVFKETLLPVSETFIPAQTRYLNNFSARFIGLGPAFPSLDVPPNSILLTTQHSVLAQYRQKLYRRMGLAPVFHRRAKAASASLVHAHFASGGRSALPLAQYLKVPLIVTLHGSDVSQRVDFRRRYGNLWKHGSLFLCVSEFIRRKAIAAGFPKQKLRLHYIGVDVDNFQSQGLPRQNNTVVFVGRLVEKKGCAFLLKALARVAQRHPNVEVVVIGDGPLRSSLKSLAGELGVSCRFLGSQPTSVVKNWLARGRMLCAPSVTSADGDCEGLPTVLMEAQAMGTPVVTTRHAGNPEAILDERTGLLAPEGDSDGLARQISRLLEDDELWGECSARGNDWMRIQFDLKQQTSRLESIYFQCLRSPTLTDEQPSLSDKASSF